MSCNRSRHRRHPALAWGFGLCLAHSAAQAVPLTALEQAQGFKPVTLGHSTLVPIVEGPASIGTPQAGRNAIDRSPFMSALSAQGEAPQGAAANALPATEAPEHGSLALVLAALIAGAAAARHRA